jgi:DNA processing protein
MRLPPRSPDGLTGPARGNGLTLSDQQRIDWLRLIRSESIGPRTFQSLINRFGGASAALEALPRLAREKLGKSIAICTRETAEQELAWAARFGTRLIGIGEPDYPMPLAYADDAPPMIAVMGRVNVTLTPSVAIVGSRNASFAGQKMAERLASELGAAGISVVSGLARGIDAAAHKAALKTGTVAVLAGGLAKPYPPDNLDLFEAIAENGAVISEMPFGWEPRGRDFPRRNRIISGLSYATVVVEAAPKSGSLITARFANEQGREVFAVPGSPLDPRAEGTNGLIFKGEARLARSAQDVLDAIAPMLADGLPRKDDLFGEDTPGNRSPLWDEWTDLLAGEAPARQAPAVEIHDGVLQETGAAFETATLRALLLDHLSSAPLTLDDVARLANAPVNAVRSVLFEMEMDGLASIDDGGLIRSTQS